MTAVSEIPFARLVASDAINARAATKDDLDALVASIAAKGLIQPLAVRPADGDRYEVIDGRRRFQAIAKLVKAKAPGWSKARMVPVLVRNEDDAAALETSLIANTQRLPMHAVEQYEVFARLAEGGAEPKEIAARFGLTERTVKQQMALGKLAPEIRKAWRDGKIEADAAMAFAVHSDATVQAATYARLKKQSFGLKTNSIKRELLGTRESVAESDGMRFVGIDAYLAAGGTLTENLFDDGGGTIDDTALLQSLVDAKFEHKKTAARADGWSWAMTRAEAASAFKQSYLDPEDLDHVRGVTGIASTQPDEFTREERARSGIVFELAEYWQRDQIPPGKCIAYYGLLKPSDQMDIEDPGVAQTAETNTFDDDASHSSSADTAVDDDASGISQGLQQTLSEVMTVAVSRALAIDMDLAMRVATAALTCRHDAPAAIRNDGHPSVRVRGEQNFTETFRALQGLPATNFDAEIGDHFARAVATTLDLTFTRWRFKGRDSGCEAVRDATMGSHYLQAVRELFLPADYFARVPKSLCLAAIDDMREAGCAAGLAPEDALAAMKKPDLAAAATAAAQACGWLPMELRHPDYAIAPPEPVAIRVSATPTKRQRVKP